MSYAEDLLYESLRLVLHPHEQVERNVRPDALKSPLTGRNLELDFFLPRFQLGIEVQGPHHFEEQQQIERDEIKRGLCRLAGIELWELSIFELRPRALRGRFLDFSRSKHIHVGAQPQTPAWGAFNARVSQYKRGILCKYGQSVNYTTPDKRKMLADRAIQNELLDKALYIVVERKDGSVFRAQPIEFSNCKHQIKARVIGTLQIEKVSRPDILEIVTTSGSSAYHGNQEISLPRRC